jgi:hypothetical protein
MVLIAADNQDVERSVEKLVMLSKQAGAEFSDDLVVRCIDGNLSIEAPARSVGKVLMRLPWHTLVPLQPFNLSVIDDDIVISSCDEGLTPSSVAFMEAILELYNLTHKLAAHRRTSPWTLLVSSPQLLEHVAQRTGRGGHLISGKLNLTGNEDQLLLQTFLHSRALNYKVIGDALPAQELPFDVLMPVLDAMNHHFQGASYSFEALGEDRCLTIKRSVPLPGMGNECFACYGPNDRFDTWVTYGFIDRDVPFLRSVAMTIELPGLGEIRLANFFKPRTPGDLPESVGDLYFYIPRILARGGGHIVVASLLIPGPGAPRALRRTLQFLVSEMNPAHPRQAELVLHAEEQIIAANRSFYDNLIAFLGTLSATDPLQKPLLDGFVRVCNLQLARIQDYLGYARS